MKDNVIVFGSSSELAQEFIKINKSFYRIYTISQNNAIKSDLNVSSYTKELDNIQNFVEKIENPYILFFNGYLAENRPNYIPNVQEIRKMIDVNYFVPFIITSNLLSSNFTIKKFVFISSFASVKHRDKNYIYGVTKKLLEFSISQLKLDNYLVIRFGKINTAMSSSHKKSIFEMNKSKAAGKIANLMRSKKKIVYPSKIIFLLSLIIRLIPLKIINLLKI